MPLNSGIGRKKGPAVFIQIGKYDPRTGRRYQTKFKAIYGVKLETMEQEVNDLIKQMKYD